MAQRHFRKTNNPREPHETQPEVQPLGFDPGLAIDTVTKAARENPHVAIVAALAAGFVLGGGVTPKLIGAIAMFAARHYVRATIEETFASLQPMPEEPAHSNL
ncbi:MAG TPA: hypothetical protein PKA58_02735 [Polyangium sp.]|nr:hypothetical protein [Polyangium sp.]